MQVKLKQIIRLVRMKEGMYSKPYVCIIQEKSQARALEWSNCA